MPRFIRCLAALSLFIASASAESASVILRKAVFSDRQLFWPDLAGKSAVAGRPQGAAARESGKPKPAAMVGAVAAEPVKVAVLPILIRDYRESIPCDSCHRLSANGMEFFLENYLKDKIHDRFPAFAVDLIAPQLPLVQARVDLMAYLDSLELPWDRWLADSGEGVVYRPQDRFTKPAARKRLDKLGGMLGAAYLLLPARVHVMVTPNSTTSHQGGLEWSFELALWNVAAGHPEWALRYAERTPSMDLDESLAGRLDKGLGAAWDGLPKELIALWNAEPR